MFNRIKEFINWLFNDVGSSSFCCSPISNESDEEKDSDDERNHFCTRCQSYHPKYYECLMKR